jgi:hypothetical protein
MVAAARGQEAEVADNGKCKVKRQMWQRCQIERLGTRQDLSKRLLAIGFEWWQ